MEWDRAKSEFLLKSGRRVYANGGIFGLAAAGGCNDVSQGWDGGLHWPTEAGDEPYEEQLFDEDIVEIAETMISRWTALRDSLTKK